MFLSRKAVRTRRSASLINKNSTRLNCEELESRLVPSSFSPTQIKSAYGFPTTLTGAGQTIAIIDAYVDKTVVSDLNAFDSKFGLPAANLQVVAYGTQTNSSWAMETALDVEWAHAIAPGAKIVLMEAKDDSFSSLITAINDSVTKYGARVVSMSWGSSEFSQEASYDSVFKAYASSGVTFVASSGDTGTASYPAESPYVLSVGGTSLAVSGSGVVSESVWHNQYGSTGGGVSKYEPIPGYQESSTFKDPYSSTHRTGPDVAYDADPNTGFLADAGGVWYQFGGTSDAAPQWAALITLANQARATDHESTLSGYSQVLPELYAMASSNYGLYFNDITSGTGAAKGYDLATGLGSPHAANIISYLTTGSGSTTTSSTISTNGIIQSNPSLGKLFTLTGFDAGSNSQALESDLFANGDGELWLTMWSAPSVPVDSTPAVSDHGFVDTEIVGGTPSSDFGDFAASGLEIADSTTIS